MDLNPVFVYEKGYAVADARIVVGDRKRFDMEIGDISFFFNPSSVAVVGASRVSGKPGNRILENLLKLQYPGKIFPVNPNADTILGLKCYPSIRDIPEKVDIAVIAIPSSRAVEIVEECAEKGVKGIVVISGGFAEGWEKGKEIEKKVVETARKNGVRVIGPNTMGILDPETGFTSFFSILREIKSGNIVVLSQSGALANFLLLSLPHVGFSRIVAIGNKCDVNEVESLKVLLDDEKTRVIGAYLEGFTNGRLFFEFLKDARKPVVILKSGRTEAGKKSALTHTASISTDEAIFEAACKQAKVVKVLNYEEFVDTLKALSMQPLPKGKRVAVIEPSGAECVMAADAVIEGGLELAEYTDKTLERLYELAPEWHIIRNPLDLYPIIEKSGDEVFFEALDIMARDENVDAIITGIFIPSLLRFGPKFDWLKKYGKPVIITLKDDIEPLRKIKRDIEVSGFPVYPIPERAVKVLRNMFTFSEKFGTPNFSRADN
jgi:acyl-CoA synthetase (NDP forming)